jgi:hypothetical protein
MESRDVIIELDLFFDSRLYRVSFYDMSLCSTLRFRDLHLDRIIY